MLSVSKYLKCSKFVFEHLRNNIVCLYHSINIKKIYGNLELLKLYRKFRKPKKVEEVLKEYAAIYRDKVLGTVIYSFNLGFLVDPYFNEDYLIKTVREKRIPSKPKITEMYLIISDRCNFRCKYCAISKNFPVRYKRSDMSWEIAKQSVNVFIKHASRVPNQRKDIVFYGGEPLLNPDIVKESIKYIRLKEQEGAFNGKVDLAVFTNGSLATSSLAQFFVENDVYVIVSLDGPKEIHNKMRVYPDGKGTFDDIIRGYNIFKEAGCNTGLSAVIGKHNIEQIEEIIKYFAGELSPVNLGLSTLHSLLFVKAEDNPAFVPYQLVSKRLINAYKIARRYGLYIEHIARKVRPFIERKVRIKECPACGALMVVAPDGQIGPCMNFLGTRRFFTGYCYDADLDLAEDSIFNDWNKRSPFNIPQCYGCREISICGGGCPYDAYVQQGDIWKPDERMCSHSKEILDWLIWELFEKVRARWYEDFIVILEPTEKEQKEMYGRIEMNAPCLPIQSYSKLGENSQGGTCEA